MAVFHDTVFKVVGVNIKAEDAFTYDDDVSKHIIEKTGCMNHIVPLLLSVVNVCALSLISDQASPFLLPLHYDFFFYEKGCDMWSNDQMGHFKFSLHNRIWLHTGLCVG